MPAEGMPRRRWLAPVVYGVLGLELAVVIVFAATYNALDFRIYMWGGHAVLDDSRLYLALAYGHWFTYSPFAAIVFVPVAALPLAVARVTWDLVSVAALAYSCTRILQIAGYRPSRLAVAGFVAAAMALDPVWETLFLGQINLILLARRTRAAFVAAGTFVLCGLIGFLVAPHASRLYWEHLSHDTSRVGAPYISNQSPYAAAIRIVGDQAHVGWWWVVISLAFAVIGLAVAAMLVRRGDWLAAIAVTGATELLVSPISWAHHWLWILPALVLLIRDGHRIAAVAGYLLFAVAPFWFTPHAGGPREYGFHGLVTLAANSFLLAGLAFLGFMAWQAWKLTRWRPEPEPLDRESVAAGAGTR